MTLRVVPEGLAAGGVVEALVARWAGVRAAPVTSAVVAPAADPVSAQTGMGLGAVGVEHVGVAADRVEELGRSGIGVGEAGPSYVGGDRLAAASHGFGGGAV